MSIPSVTIYLADICWMYTSYQPLGSSLEFIEYSHTLYYSLILSEGRAALALGPRLQDEETEAHLLWLPAG